MAGEKINFTAGDDGIVTAFVTGDGEAVIQALNGDTKITQAELDAWMETYPDTAAALEASHGELKLSIYDASEKEVVNTRIF